MPSTPADRLFVYGTLRPGAERWPTLAPFVADEPRAAAVVGSRWATPHGWPALTLDGGGTVEGVLVTLVPETADAALARLDEIEGVDVGLFRRSQVRTTDGAACWVYDWPGDTAGFRRR